MIIKTEKLRNFQAFLKKQNCAYASADIADINLLGGFPFVCAGDAYLLITPSLAFCFTREMYLPDVKKKAPFLSPLKSRDPKEVVAKAKELKLKKVYFSPERISYIAGSVFKKGGFKEKIGFSNIIKETKSEEEIIKIKKACRISAATFRAARKFVKTGITEKRLAEKLEAIMYSLGGQYPAFSTLVCFGENSANPHHLPSAERKLRENEAVLMDFGCKYGDYCSDITRTFWHGGKPSEEFKKTYEIVKAAHEEGIKKAQVGMRGADLDCVCRNYFARYKLDKYFIHSTGHGLGLEIHEAPNIAPVKRGGDCRLKDSSVFTVEPGLYFDGKFGVRYEDTVLLTREGAEILTK
jgi:Xaa-Pro aminopeptidase